MFKNLKLDIDAAMANDPAARSRFEVFLTYSGVKALRLHRRANFFYRHNMKLIARIISQNAKWRTGIEIHPAAKIEGGVFIDHGSGVVIGETAEVHKGTVIYQGVTLGGTGKEHGKRHPTIMEDVTLSAGAKVLGPIRIGNHVRIAAGAVVLNDIPDHCTAVGVPARVVRVGGQKVVEQLDQVHIPDPLMQEIEALKERLAHLESQAKEKSV